MGKRVKPMKELDHVFLRDDDPDDIDALMRVIDARLNELEKDETETTAKAEGEAEIQEKIKSCNQTDEFDLGYSHGECTEEEQKRSPLIVLKVPNSRNWSCVKGMEGKFAVDQQRGFIFHTRISLRATAHLPSTDGCSKTLLPLFQKLCAEGYVVRIVGESARGYFYVKGIHMPDTEQKPSGPFAKCLQDGQLQVLLERLLYSEHMGGHHEEIPAPGPVFTTKADLAALFRVCRHTYPPTIQEWAENSFQMLESPQLGNDDRRHILKALSYLLNINWPVRIPDVPDLNTIKRELDNRFLGLETVKERILEVAAQIRRAHSLPKWGVLLHGPAGVGKTSIANAISEILGMPKAYIDFSLIQDNEALTGSGRIYSNAKPGLIIEQIYAHRTANLVMVLNEIDKATAGKERGNPLNMLLPLLDGMGFTDTYLEVTIPTQGIFFIATCNDVGCISKPILDRFYQIDIPAYTEAEKRAIFDQYVLPSALRTARIEPLELIISDEAIDKLMREYAVEPGVRDLEQYAEKFATHYLLEKETNGLDQIEYNTDDLYKLLGPPKAVGRNYITAPGMVFSAFVHDGGAHIITVQALLSKGDGELRIVNVDSASQREYCRMAYELLKARLPGILNITDVVLAINQPICESAYNFVGLAVCAAILSAVNGTIYPSGSLFWGGCDLLGTFYLDENNLAPLLRQVAGQFDTIYAAYGAAQHVYKLEPDFSANIVELPNAQVLFELSGFNNHDRAN